MRNKFAVCVLILLILACGAQADVSEVSEAPPDTPMPVPTEAVVEASPTPIVEEAPTPTVVAEEQVETPDSAESEAVPVPGIAERLCPQVSQPAGVFRVPEFYSNSKEEDPTVYEIYQFSTLFPESVPEYCTIFIHPFVLGDGFQFGGDTLFWQSYDDEAEQATVWKYDPLDKLTDEADPHHIPLTDSMLEVPWSFIGLTGFVVAPDGESMAWSKTEPKLNDDGEYAFLQEIYFGDTIGEYLDLIWYDAIVDDYPHIIELRELSSVSYTLYYSDEPIGLGTSYPYPQGVYSSLYSMPTWGDMPTQHHDCGMEHWCISDFSEAHDMLAYFRENTIELITMSGEALASVGAPEGYNFLRQALIGPEGDVAFLALNYEDEDFFDDPDDAAIYTLAPPYDGEPVLAASSLNLRNLLGWLAADQVLTDIVFRPEINEEVLHLNRVNLSDGSMELSILQADNFIQLVP